MNSVFCRLLCGFTAFLTIFSASDPLTKVDGGGAFLSCMTDETAHFSTDVFFLGESTTAHLRSRGRVDPKQVWANSSGTMRLDSSLPMRHVTDPESGESVSIVSLAKRVKPPYLVLSFGLNGIVGFSRDTERYLQTYQKLIDAIREVSPSTRFWVQSIYPVARMERQAEWLFSLTPQQINEQILSLNDALQAMCETIPDAEFVDTSSVLRDADGYLKETFTTDGIHLTAEAYDAVLGYLAPRLPCA